MKEMNDYVLTIKSMVYGQLFVDTIDQLRGNSAFKQRVKMKGNSYSKEVEKFLNTAYGGGETESNVLELLEHCEREIEKIIEEQVVFE